MKQDMNFTRKFNATSNDPARKYNIKVLLKISFHGVFSAKPIDMIDIFNFSDSIWKIFAFV